MRGSQTCRLLCLCCQLAGCQDDAILLGTGVYARKFRNEITRRNGEVSSKGLRFGCQSCPCGANTHHLRLPSLWCRLIEYRPASCRLRWSAFACVGWQVTLCDLISQVTDACRMLSSTGMGFLRATHLEQHTCVLW